MEEVMREIWGVKEQENEKNQLKEEIKEGIREQRDDDKGRNRRDEKGIWRTEEEMEGGKGRIEKLYQRTRKFGRGKSE